MMAVFATAVRWLQSQAPTLPCRSRPTTAPSGGQRAAVVAGGRRGGRERETSAASALNTSHAFHSRLIEPALDAFEAVAREIDTSRRSGRWCAT